MLFFYLLVGILPLSDHHVLGKSFGGITLFKVLGAVCLIYAVIYRASRGGAIQYFQTWRSRLSVLFLFFTVASLLITIDTRTTDYSVLWSCASQLAFFVTAISLVDSVPRLRRTLLWTVGSVSVASLYVIKEWWDFHAAYGNGFRPGGAAGDANYYAMSALMGLVLAYYLATEKRPAWESTFALGCLVLTLAGLALAASRGGFLGMLTSFLYIVGRSRRRFRNLTITLALLIPSSLVLPFSPLNRFLHPSYGDKVGEEQRRIVWKAGWRMIREHPLWGVGAARFKPEVERYEDPAGPIIRGLAHNTYIELAAELGIPALLVFIGVLGAVVISLERVRRLAGRIDSLICESATAVQASVLGYAVCLCFLSGQYQKHLWFMVFLSIALTRLAKLQLRRARRRLASEAEASSHFSVVNAAAGTLC